MKFHLPLLPAAAIASLLLAAPLLAQDNASLAPPGLVRSAAAYPTLEGELTVRSTVAPPPVITPAPAFEQLAHGGKAITEEQAVAYPPLANDFLHADSNRNGSISKTEYEHWKMQP